MEAGSASWSAEGTASWEVSRWVGKQQSFLYRAELGGWAWNRGRAAFQNDVSVTQGRTEMHYFCQQNKHLSYFLRKHNNMPECLG